ncbi:MAG: 6-pyruvoyl-tetrahydropterin synthase-related protein, partial [Candidatus Pacearchaeota archaeon]
MNILKKILPFVFVIIFSFWAVRPLLDSGFFPIHDDTQTARVFEMKKSLLDGQFPVRWVSDLGYGYGYPIFNFYAPLAYYIGGLINILGFGALVSTKIMMSLGIIISGIFMYMLASILFGKAAGITSALFYVYAPFHALDIYVRGDVAEFWAYAFVPLIFYGLIKIYNEQKWGHVIVGSLGYAGLILSHNLTAMMVTPFILFFVLIYSSISFINKKSVSIYYMLLTVILGLLLSAFYWIPAIFEMKYTNILSQIGGGADFRDHFVCINQFWQSQWGFGGSAPGCIDGLSFMIGKSHLLISLLGLLGLIWLLLKSKAEINKYRSETSIAVFTTIGMISAIFLMLEISKFIWESIPLMAFFQYPWRFLLLASFFSSVFAGFFIWFLKNRIKNAGSFLAILAVVIISLIYFNVKFFDSQVVEFKTDKDYTNLNTLRWKISKISDEYMPKYFNKPRNENNVPNKIIEINENQ